MNFIIEVGRFLGEADVGMYLMLDIVVNNMAYNGDPNNINYGSLTPLNDQKYFHPYCPINYSDRTSTLFV